MAEITVLQADLADPVHAEAIVACIDAYSQDVMGSSAPLSGSVKAALVPGLRATASARVWLARDDAQGEFVGVIVGFVGYSTFAAKPRWNVHDISVVPAARGRGVGRAMLSRVIDDATEAGAVAVTLEVRHDNDAARHLYASLGFGDGFAPMAFWERKLA
jgi:ribosomal protein S18 acetylase RimI-like enzyme